MGFAVEELLTSFFSIPPNSRSPCRVREPPQELIRSGTNVHMRASTRSCAYLEIKRYSLFTYIPWWLLSKKQRLLNGYKCNMPIFDRTGSDGGTSCDTNTFLQDKSLTQTCTLDSQVELSLIGADIDCPKSDPLQRAGTPVTI